MGNSYLDATVGAAPARNFASAGPELESILPSQFSGARRGTAESEPVKRLMAAILQDAIDCFRNNINARTPLRHREHFQARDWLFGSGAEGPFAFENICYVLDLDPTQIRRTLKDFRGRESTESARSSDARPATIAKRSGSKRFGTRAIAKPQVRSGSSVM